MGKSHSKVGLRGFTHLQLVDKAGKIVGDSGWCENTVTNTGYNYIAAQVLEASGSHHVGFMAIGKGTTTIATDDTGLTSDENKYLAVTPSSVATGTARCTCSFDGSDNSATLTIGEVGLFKTDSTGSMFAGNTFTTSQMTTDQTLNATYELRFGA